MVSLIHTGLPKYNYKSSLIINITESGQSIPSTTDIMVLARALLWSMRTRVLSAQLIDQERQSLGLAPAEYTAAKVNQVLICRDAQGLASGRTLRTRNRGCWGVMDIWV